MKEFLKSFFKLSPIFLLAGLVMSGVDTLVAAPLALAYGAFICVIIQHYKITVVIDQAIESAKDVMMVVIVMMMAYALAEIFMVTGVGAIVIQIALKFGVTGRSIAVVALLVTCVLSVATGTSWGTYAAAIPLFMWLAHIVGGNPALTMAAAAGGAAFGDNIGLISDTTILSCGIQGVQIVDRFRHQGVWSLLCVGVSAILFAIMGFAMNLSSAATDAASVIAQIPDSAWAALEAERPSAIVLLNQVMEGNTAIYMVIPILLVVGLAIAKIPTVPCLFIGMLSAVILGIFEGSITSFTQVVDLIYTGFSGAGSWVCIMMIWVVAFGGVMRQMDAFQPIANFFVRICRKVRHLITCNAILCILGNVLLSDDVAQMATIGPVIKDITMNNVEGSEEDLYKLSLRNATFSDAVGVLTGHLIPWHVCSLYYTGLAMAVYPLATLTAFDLIKYSYLAWVSIISLLVLTYTGWDRFVPLLRMPDESKVHLIKRDKNGNRIS